MKTISLLSLFPVLAYSASAFAAVSAADVRNRVADSVASLQDVLNVPETSIPQDLMRAATCVATLNVYKAEFGFGAEGGTGLASCRTANGAWGSPFFIDLGGASFGFQIGVEKVDLTLVFTNAGARASLFGTQFKLGGNASLTAGPVGRDLSAGTDYKLRDAIYSYSTAKGLFGGLTLEGAAIFQDRAYDAAAYGKATPRAIARSAPLAAPNMVMPYIDLLSQYAP